MFSVLGFTLTALKWVAVFVFGVWAMPTTARKVFIRKDDKAYDYWTSIFLFGSLLYPIAVVLIAALALTISAAVVSGDWGSGLQNMYERSLAHLFSSYIQPFLIPLAITNGLSLLYEIGRTKRKFARAPQTPDIV